MWGRLGPVAGRLGTPLLETKPAAGAVPKQSEAMTRRTPSKKHPVARATLVFVLVMLPSWWLLAIALTGSRAAASSRAASIRTRLFCTW